MPNPNNTPLTTYPGPGQLNLLHNTFGITLILQSDTPIPHDSLPKILAHFTNTPPAPIHWTQFPAAPFFRSQNLDPQTLQSLHHQNPDSTQLQIYPIP